MAGPVATHAPKAYRKENKKMKLEYELIDNNNINLATSIQYTIFPDACAYLHYKYSIDTNYKNEKYYIAKYNNIPVAITGLYAHNEIDDESIWLGWFGVLPEFRSKGIRKTGTIRYIRKSKKIQQKIF